MLRRFAPTALLLFVNLPVAAQNNWFNPALLQDPTVAKALQSVDTRAAAIVDEWIRVTEIPSPSKNEQARAKYIREEMEKLGLTDIRTDDFLNVSGGLLLLYGIGTVIGPSVGGPVMQTFGPYALFGVTATAHLLITAHAIIRSRLRAPIPVGERDSYSSVSSGTQTTPESLALSPRSQASQPLQPRADADNVTPADAEASAPVEKDAGTAAA